METGFVNANDPDRMELGYACSRRSSESTLSPARNCNMRGYLLAWLWWSGMMTAMVDLLDVCELIRALGDV